MAVEIDFILVVCIAIMVGFIIFLLTLLWTTLDTKGGKDLQGRCDFHSSVCPYLRIKSGC